MAGSVNKVILVGNLGKRSGNPAHPGRPADRQSAHRHVGNLARQEHRRAQGKDRVASRRDLQRAAVQGRRAVPEEGRQGLHRGRAADPQMAGPGRREKYSTEVVLQGFNSTLTMLEAAPAAAVAAITVPTTPAAISAPAARAAPAPRRVRSRRRRRAATATWTTKSRSDGSVAFERARHDPRSAPERAGDRCSFMRWSAVAAFVARCRATGRTQRHAAAPDAGLDLGWPDGRGLRRSPRSGTKEHQAAGSLEPDPSAVDLHADHAGAWRVVLRAGTRPRPQDHDDLDLCRRAGCRGAVHSSFPGRIMHAVVFGQ